LGSLDGLGNGNPFAAALFEAYKPISRTNANFIFGILVDLAYGFILGGIFILLYPSLPGAEGIIKGLSFAGIAWFLRVVMSAASTYVMFSIPVPVILYRSESGSWRWQRSESFSGSRSTKYNSDAGIPASILMEDGNDSRRKNRL
jgi:hypothetical protein